MAKRIVTRIGNVFCVEIDNEFKSYFQYVISDLSYLNSSVIRVFKTRYPIDSKPKIDQIVRDEVAFYAHTVLRAGIHFGAWYKVGTSSEIGAEALKEVIFAEMHDHDIYPPFDQTPKNPLTNWYIWHINDEKLYNIGVLPHELYNTVQEGGVFPYIEIISRIKYRYFKYTNQIYDILKRTPLPDVSSYIKVENDNEITYYQFKGKHAIKQLIISGGKATRLTTAEPKADGRKLRTADFGDTNWRNQDFIEKDEFDRAWNENR